MRRATLELTSEGVCCRSVASLSDPIESLRVQPLSPVLWGSRRGPSFLVHFKVLVKGFLKVDRSGPVDNWRNISEYSQNRTAFRYADRAHGRPAKDLARGPSLLRAAYKL